jgi:8-oxo-dGTP pyrophosphatase MutT (NUDIX family)
MTGTGFIDQLRKVYGTHQALPGWKDVVQTEGCMYSAVLVPVFPLISGIRVLFIERPPFMKRHAGQIAFPGGAKEPADRGPVETALREAKEELGLSPDHVDPLFIMPAETAVTSGFVVYPVVGVVSIDPDPGLFDPDPNEVQDMFFLDPFDLPFPSFERQFVHNGINHSFTEFPLRSGKSIWGVTGRIFNRLLVHFSSLKEEIQ